MTDPGVYAAANPAHARRESVRPPPGTSNAMLWLVVGAPPAVWSLDTLISFTLHQDYCAALTSRTLVAFGGIGAMLTVVGLVALAVCALTFVLSWRARAALGGGSGDDTGDGDTDVDRRRFMAHIGLIVSLLFGYGVLLRWITIFFLSPQHCGS